MTTFAQLLTDLYTITNRPDLANESAVALRKATLKYHMAQDWIQDEVQSIVTLTPLYTNDSRYSVDLTPAPFTRFRNIKSVQEYVNPPTYGYVEFRKYEVNDLIDDYGYEKTNYFYRAGTNLLLRCDHVITQAKVTWFQLPDVTSATYNSWIANIFQDAIIEEAASKIFGMIGKPNEQKIQQQLFAENLQLLTQMAVVSGA